MYCMCKKQQKTNKLTFFVCFLHEREERERAQKNREHNLATITTVFHRMIVLTSNVSIW